jgi:hypothetical protein
MGKQPLGALSKLLLMPAAIPEFIEDLPDVLALAKKKKMRVTYSGANMMTRTMTCYSPTSSLRASGSRLFFMAKFLIMT